DKYSVFLDGTHAVTTVTKKSGGPRQKLLVVKDSFANCLIPFLAREFDIVALDINTSVAASAAAKEYGADAILYVCNAENVVSRGLLK
ncbi:MAG: hypothetical protein J6252_05940, partial [Clostridia bacterium]|nr:hypothetical protein [Clostridia bacterium]